MKPRAREAGLTLIELMIAVLLASILTAGVFNLMIGQTRTYDSQLKATVKQENLASAMEYLQRQIRMAGFGFGGCPNGVIQQWNGSAFQGTTQVALQIFDNCSLYQDTSPYPPNVLASCTARNGTDSFAVLYTSDAATASLGVINLLDHSVASANFKASTCGDIQDNDYIALWDPSSATPCVMLKVTKDPSSGKKDCKIQHNPSTSPNPPGGSFKTFIGGKDGYPPGSVVLRLGPSTQTPIKISIDSSVNPPRLVQWRADKTKAEVIAEGIEDMQISYACDLNDDGSLTEVPSSTDEWAYNVTETWAGAGTLGATTCGTGRNIRAVRITLVGRSLSPEPGVTSRRPALENRAVGATDNYARAVLTATVKPRNIMRTQ